MTSAPLETRELSVHFGGVRALAGCSLSVGQGELVGLIGPNGAGKTTFIDAVTGFVKASGSVKLAGVEVSAANAHSRARQGLGRTWQSTEMFDDLTVRENLAVACHRPNVVRTAMEVLRCRAHTPPHLDETLELLGLADLAEALPGELTYGQRKLVDVGRALASRPTALLLDEPAAGLDTRESEQLGRQLRTLAGHGQSMLLVDHDMGLVLGACDRIAVLNFGELIATGTPAEIRANDRVAEAYLGQSEGSPA